jgi:hypothetical protein
MHGNFFLYDQFGGTGFLLQSRFTAFLIIYFSGSRARFTQATCSVSGISNPNASNMVTPKCAGERLM